MFIHSSRPNIIQNYEYKLQIYNNKYKYLKQYKSKIKQIECK